MYRLLFTQRALKDLEDLDKKIQDRIAIKLTEFREDPLKFARKLTNSKIGTYRFRIGDYRVVFDIDDELIVILRIGHRKRIYKK